MNMQVKKDAIIMQLSRSDIQSDKAWRRIVVKVGTSTIVDATGDIKYPVINRLAQTLTQLQNQIMMLF